jgi:hypothetical protein
LKVQGDNKNNSIDSSDYGPIPKGLVIGNPLMKIYPFEMSRFLIK